MTLSSIKMLTDLNYWIYQYIINSTLNKYKYYMPSSIKDIYLSDKSFIELLFNENYSFDEYYYLYNENTTNSTWPSDIRTRLMIYPGMSQYYEITDSTSGENLFLIQDDDLTLLNSLLSYRNDSTSVTIIDSTSETSFNILTKTLSTNYNILNTNLSKLIFIYLKFKIENNITLYGELSNIISDDDKILECFYEAHISDEIFKYISNNHI